MGRAALARQAAFQTQRTSKRQMAIKPTEALDDGLAQFEAALKGTTIGFFDWAIKVPEPKTGVLNFDVFPPQVELYKTGADDKHTVIMKSTQVGISAWALRWSLYHADTKGWTGLYVFPTKADMWDYADLRVDPLLDCDFLRSRRTPDDPDNKGMKGVGLGVVVYRGSENKRQLDSVDCDHIVFDEYDTLAQANIPDAEMRVSSPLSPGLIRRVGVPSDPEWGIHAAYLESDRRTWQVKCWACGEWQQIDFWKNVRIGEDGVPYRACAECGRSLEEVIAKGQWVAEFPDRGAKGYHFSRLIIPGAKLEDTVKASKATRPEPKKVFYTKHLGLPLADATGGLTREVIQAAQTRGDYNLSEYPNYTGAGLVTMGVDVASVRELNVRISLHMENGEKVALYLGQVDRFVESDEGEGDTLEALMRRYRVRMCAIDHLPDGRMSRRLVERFPGLVYLTAFDTTPFPKNPEVLKVNDDMAFASVRRTPAIDATVEWLREGRNLLPWDLPESYVRELLAPRRIVEEDELGRKYVRWEARDGSAQDWAMAEVYDTVAGDLWLYRQAVGAAEEQDQVALDDVLDFHRSRLADYTVDPEHYVAPTSDDLSSYEGLDDYGYASRDDMSSFEED